MDIVNKIFAIKRYLFDILTILLIYTFENPALYDRMSNKTLHHIKKSCKKAQKEKSLRS